MDLNRKIRLTGPSRCAIQRPVLAPLPPYSSVSWSKVSEAQSFPILLCINKRERIIPVPPAMGCWKDQMRRRISGVFENLHLPFKHRMLIFKLKQNLKPVLNSLTRVQRKPTQPQYEQSENASHLHLLPTFLPLSKCLLFFSVAHQVAQNHWRKWKATVSQLLTILHWSEKFAMPPNAYQHPLPVPKPWFSLF